MIIVVCTPSGNVSSTFTGSKHSHTFTPSGSISDTTAGGRISYNGGHTHIVKDPGHTHEYLSGNKNETDENGPGIDPNRYNTTIRSTGIVNSVTGISIDIGGTHTHDYYGTAHTHTFTGKEQTVSATQGGTVASSFTGTAGTTGSTTQAGTVASTFTVTSSSTGSVGSATAVNVLPPYIVKYCLERTA